MFNQVQGEKKVQSHIHEKHKFKRVQGVEKGFNLAYMKKNVQLSAGCEKKVQSSVDIRCVKNKVQSHIRYEHNTFPHLSRPTPTLSCTHIVVWFSSQSQAGQC